MSSALSRVVSLYVSAQFARFLLVGGVALLCNWLSRFAFNAVVSFGWAVVLAYLTGMLVAFTLNKIYVFPYSGRSLRFEMFFFSVVNVAAFPFVWIVAYALGEWVLAKHMPRDYAFALAHALAITLPVFANFALHKFITFRDA